MGWCGKKKSRVCTCFGFSIMRPCKIIIKPPLPQPFFSSLWIFNIRSCALGLLCQKAKIGHETHEFPKEFSRRIPVISWVSCVSKMRFHPLSPFQVCLYTDVQTVMPSHTDNFQIIQFCSPFPKQCLPWKVGTAELWSSLLTGSQGSHQEQEESCRKALESLRTGHVCICWCCRVMWPGLLC